MSAIAEASLIVAARARIYSMLQPRCHNAVRDTTNHWTITKMKPIQQIALHDPLQLVVPVGLLLATLAAGYVVKRVLFRALHRWAEGTSSRVDHVLTESLATPIMIWSLI